MLICRVIEIEGGGHKHILHIEMKSWKRGLPTWSPQALDIDSRYRPCFFSNTSLSNVK